MRAEAVMFALIKASAGIVTLVANRIYLARMTENATYPAIVLEVVSGNLVTPINAQAGMQLLQTRIQVTALSRTAISAKQILDLVRIACEFKSGLIACTIGGTAYNVQVQSVMRDSIGPDIKSDDLAVCMQSHDYMVTHYET